MSTADALIPTRTSYGILLCRINETTRKPEVLVVHKRHTYAYIDFINGKYSTKHNRKENIVKMLKLMTYDELLDIYSLNFEQMWYRAWLTVGGSNEYQKKLAKFHSTFLKDDKGRFLRKAIQNIKATGTLYYEFPKGKKNSSKESKLSCAIREVKEETCIDKKHYRILPFYKRYHHFIDMGVRYITIYYIALALPQLQHQQVSPNFLNGEVSEVKWMNYDQLQLVDNDAKALTRIIKPVFKIVKKWNKNRLFAVCPEVE